MIYLVEINQNYGHLKLLNGSYIFWSPCILYNIYCYCLQDWVASAILLVVINVRYRLELMITFYGTIRKRKAEFGNRNREYKKENQDEMI